MTTEEMEQDCREYFRIHTTENALALTILQNKIGMQHVEVGEDGSIHIFEGMSEIEQIVQTLFENDVIPLEIGMCEANLEQYYLNLIGSMSEPTPGEQRN